MNDIHQVAVLRRQNGEHQAQAQTQTRNEKNGKEKRRHPQHWIAGDPGGLDKKKKNEKNGELDAKSDEVYPHGRQWNDKPGEINFSEQGTILNESEGSAREAFGEKGPQYNACQVKQGRRQTVGRQPNGLFKDQNVYNQYDHRLEYDPQGPKQGLLMMDEEIPADDPEQQVPVPP